MKYDAFISYRHAPMDIEVSEQIHKRLESIRVPRSIRKTSGKRKIERVFRDQEELTVSSSLSDEILTALDQSEYLIVVCSPRTPESEWVANEVSYFIKVHGREHILPVIIEGEPKDSFPKPLLFEERREVDVHGESFIYQAIAEPFAADYRAPDARARKRRIKQDIFRLAAPILGCRYDDLKQRHRDQKNRRIAIGATAFAVLAVLFGSYNYYQNQRILENYKKQQMTQSMFLADTSSRLLEEGDRTNAVLVALEALPKNIDQPDRPVVAQAEYALSNALNAYAIGSDLVPDYTIEHADVVTENVQCAPSGTFFAMLDSRGVLNLFDMATGKAMSEWNAATDEIPSDRIYDYNILANDRVIAFSGAKIICINGKDGSLVWEVRYDSLDSSFRNDGFLSGPYHALSGDESVIAVKLVGYDDAYLLDLSDGGLKTSLTVGSADLLIVSRLVLSKDSTRLAVVYSDTFSESKISVFDVKDKTVLTSFDLAYSVAFLADFTPDGKLICGSYDFTNWNEESGEINMQITSHDINQETVLWTSEISVERSLLDLMINKVRLLYSEEGGDHILLTVENRVFVFDLATGVKISEIVAPSYITGSTMNVDTGLFVYTTDMGQVKWCDMYTGREYSEYDFSVQTEISAMVGGSGHMIIVPYDSKSIMVYSYVEAPGLEKLQEFDPDEYTYLRVVSPDGKYLLIGRNTDAATNAYVFDTASGELIAKTALPALAECAAFDENGILFGMMDGSVQYYDLEKNAVETVMADEDSQFAFYMNDAQTHLVLTKYDRLQIMSTETRKIVFDTQLDNEQFVAVTDNADYVLMKGEDGLFAIRTGDGSRIAFDEHVDLIEGYALQIPFAHDNDYAAIPGTDQYIHIIDLKSGKTISRIAGAGTDVFSGYFINHDTTFVFQSNDYRIRAASVDSGRLIYTGEDELGEANRWSYDSERKILAVISYANALLLNVDDGIYPTAEVPYFLAFSQDSKYVYVYDSYTLARFPNRDLKDLYQIAGDLLGDRTLSEENRMKFYIDG